MIGEKVAEGGGALLPQLAREFEGPDTARKLGVLACLRGSLFREPIDPRVVVQGRGQRDGAGRRPRYRARTRRARYRGHVHRPGHRVPDTAASH